MAPALVRSLATRNLSLCVLLPKRLLSTFSITHPPSLPTVLPWRQSLPSLSHALQSINKTTNPTRFTAIRCRVNRAGNSGYSPLNSGSNFSDRPPNEMAPLFPGCDYEHWLIVMDKPGGEGATKQQMIDCYIQTLSKVVGSEEEAKKKIYNVSCERYFGFGCEIDEETSNKLEGLPGVLFVLPDSYVDPEYKDYGETRQKQGKNSFDHCFIFQMEENKKTIINRLVAVKRKSGKSCSQIAEQTGLTNVYVAQLLRRQAQLNPDTAPKLREALPELPEDLLQEMMRPPMRSYDPSLIQEPCVYRLNEAVMHFGESIKEIINEEFGDGIMSAIDFYCSVDKVKGVDGKDRVVVTFDGKYLPYTEQKSEHMVSRPRPH